METSQRQQFSELFNQLSFEIFSNAQSKGWWANERSVGECIALMHSELSECLEAYREGSPSDKHLPEFSATEVELADCIIRIMDFGAKQGLDIGGALLAKHEFNKTRPYKHGGKAF